MDRDAFKNFHIIHNSIRSLLTLSNLTFDHIDCSCNWERFINITGQFTHDLHAYNSDKLPDICLKTLKLLAAYAIHFHYRINNMRCMQAFLDDGVHKLKYRSTNIRHLELLKNKFQVSCILL